jgi:hypothetical protein
VLRNATSIVPASPFVLAPGEAFASIEAHLTSLDQYLVVLGSADAADGLGASSFSLAVAPGAAVPEPGTLGLMTLGLAGIARLQRRSAGGGRAAGRVATPSELDGA